MTKYITKSGDTFDIIAFTEMGSCKFVDLLINANRDKIEQFIFPAGIELKIPEIPTEEPRYLPPWR